MQFSVKVSYPLLYRVWCVVFAITGILGLLFPGAEHPVTLFCLRLITVLFFLPPWLILVKAKDEGNQRHVKIVRYLAMASLSATVLLFWAAVMAIRLPEIVGTIVHVMMTILCAPLVCSNYYVLPMFLWAMILIFSFGKKK